MSEQILDAGGVSRVPSAACSRERGRRNRSAMDCSGFFTCPSSWMKGFPLSSQEFRSAVPFSSILLLRSRYPFSITLLKGGLL